MTALAELDAMIAAGWGSTPQDKIPVNWREVLGPAKPSSIYRRRKRTRIWQSATPEAVAQRWAKYHERKAA